MDAISCWSSSIIWFTQQQQQQRPLLNHPHLQDEQQLRLRQQQHDFNPNIANQFQQPFSSD